MKTKQHILKTILILLALTGIAEAYYAPQLGRFLSRDPIEEKGGINLHVFVRDEPIGNWDKLGLVVPKLDYTSDSVTVGECGSFEWKINWKVSPKSSRLGGVILQKMHILSMISKDTDSALARNDKLSDDYYEAWRVSPNSKQILSQVWVDPNSRDGSLSETPRTVSSQDRWYIEPQDGTRGETVFEGDSSYINNVSIDVLSNNMNAFERTPAGGLFESTNDPRLGGVKSPSLRRVFKVSWCCLAGATAEQRKTKIIEVSPSQYTSQRTPIY